MFPLDLPYGVIQHVLSFIPPKWTEINRDDVLPPDGHFMMVLAKTRCKYRDARIFLVNPLYQPQDVMTLRRDQINFMVCEARDFLAFQGKPLKDEIKVEDIFPKKSTPDAIEQLYKFNESVYLWQISCYI